MSTVYAEGYEYAVVNGVRLHYALEGPAGSPVLVLVNMASHNLTVWELVLETLLCSFRILRFDIRGTGKSDWGGDGDFTFAQYADDLAGLMDTLEIPSAYLVGMAYGCRTVARFALRHPQRLSALAMFDASLIYPVKQEGQHDSGLLARQMLERAGEPLIDMQKHWRFYENRDAALKSHSAHEEEPDLTEQLAQVGVPTLIACGEQDMNLQESRRLADAIPCAHFVVMTMTGHGSLFYRPQLVANLVIDHFIDNGG